MAGRQPGGRPPLVIESYFALGDGISMDPLLPVSPTTPGPASILASDLARNHACGKYKNYCRERSRMNTIWLNALPSILASRGEIVVTITTGLEDLIDAGLEAQTRGQTNSVVQDAVGGYQRLVRTLRRLLPNATIVGTTIPDPTLGEGRFPLYGTRFPSFGVILFNDLLKDYAERTGDGFYVADVFDPLFHPEAWASSDNIQLSSYGANVVATVWQGELMKAGVIPIPKAVA